MIENICVDEHLAAAPEKEKGYGSNYTDFDFLARGELTVTISLAEYRKLLTSVADTKVDEANRKRWEIDAKNQALQKELDSVKQQLAELRKMFTGAALEAVASNKEVES